MSVPVTVSVLPETVYPKKHKSSLKKICTQEFFYTLQFDKGHRPLSFDTTLISEKARFPEKIVFKVRWLGPPYWISGKRWSIIMFYNYTQNNKINKIVEHYFPISSVFDHA